MREAAITGWAAGGGSLACRGPAEGWLSPEAVDEFAQRHRKALRYLNHGSVLTAALVESVLARRWPSAEARPGSVALLVGSAFGNQGETVRYFRSIHASGPADVAPMMSYDVAVNSFTSFCSIFFGCKGPVQLFSSGAVSGLEALAGGVSLLDAGAVEAVLVAGVDCESDLVTAYGLPGEAFSPAAEAGAVLLLERPSSGAPLGGRVLSAATCFAVSDGGRSATLSRLTRGLLQGRQTPRGAVYTGPRAVPARPPALAEAGAPAWLEIPARPGAALLGAAGPLGCIVVLERLRTPGRGGVGLVVSEDPLGWVGGAVLGAAE